MVKNGLVILVLALSSCHSSLGHVEPYVYEEPDVSKNIAVTEGSISATPAPINNPPTQYLIGRAIDGDPATFGGWMISNATGSASLAGEVVLQLSAKRPIETINLYGRIGADGTVSESNDLRLYYWDYGTGAYVQFATVSPFGASEPEDVYYNLNKSTDKIKFTYDMAAAGNAPGWRIFMAMYEFRVMVPNWNNSGLRINTSSGVIELAKDEVELGALRLRRNGVTISLPLIPSSHPGASPLRISKGATIYSIGRYTF